MNALEFLVMLLAFAACLRMVFYHRKESNYKPHLSFVAYLAIVATGWLGIALVVDLLNPHPAITAVLVPSLFIYTGVIYYTRGNVAEAFRIILFTRLTHD